MQVSKWRTFPAAILQRTTIGIGKLKIQGVATCQYLCMDMCGFPYGSMTFGDECIFSENIEQHYYNTYSSSKYSSEKRTLYLALNRRGQPRKVMLRARQQLGRLSSYTRVLTRTVSSERLEEFHHMRHHTNQCPPGSNALAKPVNISTTPVIEYLRCRKKKKKKKKKQKPTEEGGYLCHKKLLKNTKKCDNAGSEGCQRDSNAAKKQKSHSDKNEKPNYDFKKKRPKKCGKARQLNLEVHATTEDPNDRDYGLDSTTNWEWEETTLSPTTEAPQPTESQIL